MPYWMQLTLMYTDAKWCAAAQRRRAPNRRLTERPQWRPAGGGHLHLAAPATQPLALPWLREFAPTCVQTPHSLCPPPPTHTPQPFPQDEPVLTYSVRWAEPPYKLERGLIAARDLVNWRGDEARRARVVLNYRLMAGGKR